jgi:hypothetical protein
MPRSELSSDSATPLREVELAPERLSRALAYVHAALDEVGTAERTVTAARAQLPRTSAHEQLDDAADLMRRARAVLGKLLSR